MLAGAFFAVFRRSVVMLPSVGRAVMVMGELADGLCGKSIVAAVR